MIALALRFPTGRYHATGWDHHVNEGTVEWPPSPWRILRALVSAAWRSGLGVQARPVIEALFGLPVYHLPPATAGHTRHYMPTHGNTTLVFDSFRAVHPDQELVVAWPELDLDPSQRATLQALLPHIAYLGRAESRVEIRLLSEFSGPWHARPGPGLRLPAVGNLPPHPGGKIKLPATLWEALHAETGSLHKEAWSMPPGMRWADYEVKEPPLPRNRTMARDEKQPVLAWFALASRVHARVTATLPVAERIRAALMSRSRQGEVHAHPVFSGKDAEGTPLVGDQHAYVLPTDEDGDGFLDHCLVYARFGFDPRARQALESLRLVHSVRDAADDDLRMVLLGLWEEQELAQLPAPPQQRYRYAGPSKVWQSVTPFFLPRHPKQRASGLKHGPEEQLRWCLARAGLPEPRSVVELPGRERSDVPDPNAPPWYRFRAQRRGGGSLGLDQPFAFRIEFFDVIRRPIALGYAAHQGLGLFAGIEP
jgi:CRISPR-associated protein Csb2